MNFLKQLFGKERASFPASAEDPENTKLNFLLDIWGKRSSDENYKAVMEEILKGNSFLLLPSVNENDSSGGWRTAQTDTTLQLTSVFNVDGLQVLGAFSNESALLEWAQNKTEYTALRTQDIIAFCQQHGIDRLVINSKQKNMFVLERNLSNIQATTLRKETEVLVGTPANPLSAELIHKLVAHFGKVDTIEEAYQYAQHMNGEPSIVLGIKMSVVNDNSRLALQSAINSSLSGEKMELPLDIMVLDDGWLKTVRGLENSLFYKR